MLPARRGDSRGSKGYSKSFAIVPYLTPEEIELMVERVKKER